MFTCITDNNYKDHKVVFDGITIDCLKNRMMPIYGASIERRKYGLEIYRYPMMDSERDIFLEIIENYEKETRKVGLSNAYYVAKYSR